VCYHFEFQPTLGGGFESKGVEKRFFKSYRDWAEEMPVRHRMLIRARAILAVAALLAVCGFSSGSEPALVIRAVAPPLAAGVTPRSLAVDRRDGALYVSTEANRILALSAAHDSAWQNFAGSGAKGSLGDGGPAASAQFDFAAPPSGASGMALDREGNLFIADTNNATIRRVDAATGVVSSVAGRWATGAQSVTLVEPVGVALDAAGDLFIADRGANEIFVLRSGAQQLAPLAQVVKPVALAARDPYLYAASPTGGFILRLNMQDGAAMALAGANQAGMFARLARTSPFGQPVALAVDGAGNVFFSDAATNTIRRADARTGAVSLIAGTGRNAVSPDDAPASQSPVSAPGDLAFDAAGNLFFLELGAHRIREIPHAGVPPGRLDGVDVSLVPSTINFNPEPVGGTQAAPGPVVLTNNTGATLTFTGITFTGITPNDFTETDTCGAMLPAGGTCNIFVTFAPKGVSVRDATLNVNDNDPSSPQTVSLSGLGDDYELGAAPNGSLNITVNSGSTANFMLQVTPDPVFSGTVTITCSDPAKDSTCPSSIMLPVQAGVPTMFTLPVTTVMHNSVPPGAMPRTPFARFPAAFAAALLALLLCALLAARRTRGAWRWPRRKRALVPVLAGLALFGILAGCGYKNTPPAVGTPAGNYAIELTATAQGASRPLTLVLTVK
jgi:sugar lactone lactonase YvrE